MTDVPQIDGQVMLAWPDDPDDPKLAVKYEEHVDKAPDGEVYGTVFGVAVVGLTTLVFPRLCAQVDIGHNDILVWPGYDWHHSVPNLLLWPRMIVYGRTTTSICSEPAVLRDAVNTSPVLAAIWRHIRTNGLQPGYFGHNLTPGAADLPEVRDLLTTAWRTLTT